MTYDTPVPRATLDALIPALKLRGVEAMVVKDRAAALAEIQKTIPAGASVLNGASVTLEEIGFVDLLTSGKHPWNNLKAAMLAEKDPEKQKAMRRQNVLADWYLGSVHAVAEDGQFVIGSNTGSQLPHVVYTSPNLIFVVGAQKIVPTLADALNRIEDYVVPLEDVHMMGLYKVHTMLSKLLIWKNEAPGNKRTIRMILVEEKLGF